MFIDGFAKSSRVGQLSMTVLRRSVEAKSSRLCVANNIAPLRLAPGLERLLHVCTDSRMLNESPCLIEDADLQACLRPGLDRLC